MTCRESISLNRAIKTKAEVAAECRAAAAEYQAMADRATAAGNAPVAEHFTTLATRRRLKALELERQASEGGKG